MQRHGLPLPAAYCDVESYVTDLLSFVTNSPLLQTLCGGVHILDFLTRDPDLYSWVLQADWREWFASHELEDILYFFLHQDLSLFQVDGPLSSKTWRGRPNPPSSLVLYIKSVRDLLLAREPGRGVSKAPKLSRQVAVGMNVKKTHEVQHFSQYIVDLIDDLSETKKSSISHVVDFGAGQNYLGRALASQPYNKHVIAVEGRSHNVEGARKMDVSAKVAPKKGNFVNKKEYRARLAAQAMGLTSNQPLKQPEGRPPHKEPQSESAVPDAQLIDKQSIKARLDLPETGLGSVQHVEHNFSDGNLSQVIEEITDSSCADPSDSTMIDQPQLGQLLTVSIHSCGNLSHHGLRSLVLNDNVKAVAIIGCCYNLLTERLTAPSYKHPRLRPGSKLTTLGPDATEGDPHGFPMSTKMVNYQTKEGTGVHLNITARMMAVQAPQNWGREDSESFFTRHFYRALLQKVFLDRGIVEKPLENDADYDLVARGGSPAGTGGAASKPIIIGSLRKSCYTSFVNYTRGALARLTADKNDGMSRFIYDKMSDITDEEIEGYECSYLPRKKDLSIIWSLMAYSAGLVEATIVVDRWLWLREQPHVDKAWVEAVWDYKQSPRNLVLVGIKK